MINLQKVDNKNKVTQPAIMMFASPAITPSNNFKTGSNLQRDTGMNSSQIQGRKCDSPQLRVMRDQFEGTSSNSGVGRPQTASNSMHIPTQLKKDDFLQLYNYHNQIRDLNHTNKEIQKKQFDFNINKNKANVTIQYDNTNDIHRGNKQNSNYNSALNNTHIENNRTHKSSKSIGGGTQKRRQQSQSIPRHQPTGSIVNTQAQQPLVNLHIQNAKISSQLHPQVTNKMKQKRAAGSNSQIPQKFQQYHSSGQQSAQAKSRSKSKNRQKSSMETTNNKIINSHIHNYNSQLPPGTQQRAAFMAQATKEILNQSNMNNYSKVKSNYMFSFDNKENESINYNEFSPSRIIGKPQNAMVNNFLDSDSSDECISQNRAYNPDQQIAQKLGKQYFLDKSTLLKHLSPERNQQQSSKTRINKSGILNQSVIPQQILSDRDNKSQGQNFLSNGSTIIHAGLNESAINKTANQSLVNIKFKKPINGTIGSLSTNNKVILKGVDKLIKENLKRNKTKEEEEISKKYLEEFKQKLKKNELTQRNQQVRKINASKIMYNHQHKNSQVQGRVNLHRLGYKKQRSKSCMNKTDNIFNGIHPRSKERLPVNKNENQFVQQICNIPQPTNLDSKKEKKREKSFVLEIRDLQKQIDGEIRREIMQGKLDIQPTSAANKKTNLTTINAKRDNTNNICIKPKKELLNMSVIDNVHFNMKRSNEELIPENFTGKRKSKSKDKNKSISQNIKKFMEKKKNAQQQLKSLEQTIENKKHQKIKENLKSLHQFAKQHFRHQSYNFYPKKKQDLNPLTNILQQNESGKALPVKKLKPQFFNNKKKRKSAERLNKKNFDFRGDGETIFDDECQDNSITPHNDDRYNPNNGDVSREFFDDYQRILKSIQKHQKQKVRDSSNSNDRSNSNGANKRASSGKKKQQTKQKIHNQLQKELEVSNLQQKNFKNTNKNNQTMSIDSQPRYPSIKNDNVYVPSVVQEKGASLIPPQSDIATLERNHLDKSQNINQKRYSDIRRSHDSGKTNGRSPKLSEQKAKVKSLMNKYGHILPQSQLAAQSADTKLLIKLHSAAITIQQNYRRHLQLRCFYDNESSDPHSQMYVDSDEDNNAYPQYIDTTEKKQVYQKQLIANTSPLRVKAKYQQQQQNHHIPNHMQIQHKLQPQLLPQKGNKFYSEDSSDIEKVVVCSVITSGRADGEESLSNTQKYVPLRQKLQLQTSSVPPKQVQHHQQQIIPSSTSSAQSQMNTVIKTQPVSLQQRLKLDQQQEQQQQQSIDYSQQSSSSQRKRLVPSLDFGKLNTIQQKEQQKEQQVQQQEAVPRILKPMATDEEIKNHDQGSNTARSVFERHTFQDFQQKINNGEGFNMNNYPEMIKMREEAIKYRESEEQKHLAKMVKTKQMSPRTYDIKCRELETWVTKEKEEVKKTRKVFEEQWTKTAQIIEQTQKNQDNMKKLLNDNSNSNHAYQQHQHPSQLYNNMVQLTKTNESLPSENTIGAPIISHRLSSRREDSTRLLDMIDDYKGEQNYQEVNKVFAAEQARKQKEQYELHQRQKDQERLQSELERKKEIEQLKEQERQKEIERQKRIQEEEKKRREEQDKQDKIRETEKLRQIQLEKERLKKEEEERVRKIKEAEEKRQKELELKLKQEQDLLIKKKQEQEELKRKQEQEETERQRKIKEQQEQEKQRKIKEEELKQQKLREEQEKLQKIAIQKQKEEEERIKQENQIKKQKQAEELEKQLILQKEEEQKQREEEQLKKQREQEQELKRQQQLKQQQEDQERKQKEVQEQERKRKEQEEQDKKLRQQQLEELNRKQREQDEQEALNQQQHQQSQEPFNEQLSDVYVNSDSDRSLKLNEDTFLNNVVNRGKEILASQPDDDDNDETSENKQIKQQQQKHSLNQYFNEDSPQSPQSQSSKSRQEQLLMGGQGLGKHDDNRQLVRTTSSQNLDHRSIEAYQQFNNTNDDIQDDYEDDQQESKDKYAANQMRSESPYDNLHHPSTSKLNDDSFDEEKLNAQLLERQEKNNQIVGNIIKKENFFSQGFDDQKPEELLSSIQRTIDETKNLDMTQESKLTHPTIDKIIVLDESEYNNTHDFIEPTLNNNRLTQQMRSQIPVEQEELNPHGLPVSPISASDIRITTGAQSLESTISDGEQIKNAIIEANRHSGIDATASSPVDSIQQQQQSDIDKQADSITDDIFRQLMAEMKVDLDLLLLTDPRRLFREETTNAAQNQNQFLSESGRFLIFERRGIKTDLFAIERYVEEVLDEILKDQNKFQQSITQAISKNAKEVLNQLQNSEIGSYEHFEPNYPVVLPLDLYLRLERRRKENREREVQAETRDQSMTQQQIQDRNFLAECEHIHNKVLFDCINDSLLQFKPYGKDGMPLPWSRQNRRLKPIEEFTIEEMFEIVKHDLFRWAIMQAGTLPRREFVFNNLFDDELFAEIREKKLATLLAREMIENESKWLNYEFEEAQVKIDIGDMILEQLVTETITILKKNEALSASNFLNVLI